MHSSRDSYNRMYLFLTMLVQLAMACPSCVCQIRPETDLCCSTCFGICKFQCQMCHASVCSGCVKLHKDNAEKCYDCDEFKCKAVLLSTTHAQPLGKELETKLHCWDCIRLIARHKPSVFSLLRRKYSVVSQAMIILSICAYTYSYLLQ